MQTKYSNKSEEFSDFLRSARKQIGLTQDEFADILGVTRNYVSMLELGVRKPSRKLVCKIESLGNSSLPGAQVVSDGELAAEVVGKCEPAHDKRISYAEGLDEKSVRVSESADTSEPMNRPSVFRPSTTSRPFSRESAAQLIADLRRATDRLALETDPLFRFATLGAVESVVTELRRRADGGSRNLEPI